MTYIRNTISNLFNPQNWSQLTMKGLESEQYSLQKSRLLVSYFGAVGAFLMIPQIIIDLAFSNYEIIPLLVLLFVIFASIYWLNEKGYHNIARIWGVIGISFILFIICNLVGKPNGVQLFFFPLIICGFVFFEHYEYLKKVLYILFIISLILISESNEYSLFPELGFERAPDQFYFILNLVVSVLLVIWIVGYIITINRKMEHFLISKEKDLIVLTDEIKKQNEILAKTNTELDRFVYSTSHDLRAPLKSILGLLHLAEADKSPEAQVKYLEMIEGRILRLDGFIQDIIDYSKNSRTAAKFESIDFQLLYNEIIEDLRFITGVDSIQHIQEVEKVNFYSDEGRIRIIMNNLISNAIKHHNYNQANPYIKFSVKKTESGVRISVEDNGIGIKEEYHSNLFDMFYRASLKSEGSGLGLYIVKEITDKLNGSLTFESVIGVGSTFYVTLPDAKS